MPYMGLPAGSAEIHLLCFTAMPAKPAELVHVLATREEADFGRAQAKRRFRAIDAASRPAGAPFPPGKPPSGHSGQKSAGSSAPPAARYAQCFAARIHRLKCRRIRRRTRAPKDGSRR